MNNNLSAAEAATATEFAAALTRRDYRAAVTILTNVTNAGGGELAATMLQSLVEAGTDAVAKMAERRTVTVTQKIGTVPAGATVIGYQGGRI